jgi:glucuronate isomerase
MLKKFNVEYLSPCVGAREFLTGFTRFTGLRDEKGMNPVNPVNPVQNNYKVTPSLRMNASDEIPVEALEKFDSAGCRVVDISVDDASQLSTFNSQLSTVAAYAAAHGWTMLLHLGALRETSARLRAAAGPAGGFAGMRAPVDPAAVAAFLNGLESTHNPVQNALPRTILLSLNPEAHASLAVLAGSFNGAGLPGKVQLGPAWWWCDHEEGIRDVLEKNAAYGVLSTFVGMTTDSRSLLSFVRHDYFRRILCKWVAEKVASGSFPDDESLLRPMMENICYKNAKRVFSRPVNLVNPVNPV